LDPKLGFGQPGADGKVVSQPTVTVRWENITAEQALNALLGNHNLQLLEDPKSKIARVTAKDPAALPPLLTRVIQLHYSGPLNLLSNIQGALTDKQRSKVFADVRTSQLVAIATEPEIAAIEDLVERLDTPTKQVLIEARLIEISLNPSATRGVDWSGTLEKQNVTFGNGLMSGSSQTSIPGASTTTTLPGGRTITSSPGSSTATTLSSVLGGGGLGWNTISGFAPGAGFLNADGLHAVLSFLNSYAETKVLSSPRTVTLDNEQSVIEVGTMFPIVNTTAGTANTTGGSQIAYSNLTVRLEVTPRISANNSVHLKVVPKILRLGDLISSKVGGVDNSVYEFNKRELNTTVMIPSGNTLVMGGLIEDDIHRANIKVPVLGDIPGLGLLFRSDTQSRTKSNLIIFITPTIVGEDDFQPTQTTYLKTPMPDRDAFEDDWSAWNSGKPKDWSKPKKDQPKSDAPQPTFDDSVVPSSNPSVTTTNSIP
jgi:type IV pilus assembly protein PilQ